MARRQADRALGRARAAARASASARSASAGGVRFADGAAREREARLGLRELDVGRERVERRRGERRRERGARLGGVAREREDLGAREHGARGAARLPGLGEARGGLGVGGGRGVDTALSAREIPVDERHERGDEARSALAPIRRARGRARGARPAGRRAARRGSPR